MKTNKEIIKEFKKLLFTTVIEKKETKGVGFFTLLLSFSQILSQQKEEVRRPIEFRKGQNVFNFLEWLAVKKKISKNQNNRMADPFHISDEDFDKYYKEYLKQYSL